jgi:hypothetical protein
MLETLKGLPVLASPCAGVYLAHGRFIANARKAIGAYAEVPDTADTSLGNLLVMLPHLADISWGEIPRLARDGWQAPRLMLVGHTHKACAWQPRDNRRDGARWLDRTAEINAGPVWFEDLQDRPVFANPGSVGFPRDCTPGFATYMLVDWQETAVGLWLRRVQYDPTETIQTMRNVGTPELVIQQLEPRNRGARPSVI